MMEVDLMHPSCDSWDSDDEYEKFIKRMNPPRVVIDNESCVRATVVRVDSANKYGILLEVVQVLTDLNLIINKAYISSDGGWFMDVFNVTDHEGNKIRDETTIKEIVDYIRKSLGAYSPFLPSRRRSVDFAPSSDYTSIELTGTDRPGLLSEVSAVLTDLKCNVVTAEIWTHNNRAAAVMQVTDEITGAAITDPEKLSRIKELLCNVLKGNNKTRGAKTAISKGVTHTERRLHQMMFADRDYQRTGQDMVDETMRPKVSVVNCYDKDYSVITIQCKDRPKLLFDTICTLTDMQYVVFHANADGEGLEAYQEYYIRHIDGFPVNSEAERDRIIQCLEAAIEKRGWVAQSQYSLADLLGLIALTNSRFFSAAIASSLRVVSLQSARFSFLSSVSLLASLLVKFAVFSSKSARPRRFLAFIFSMSPSSLSLFSISSSLRAVQAGLSEQFFPEGPVMVPINRVFLNTTSFSRALLSPQAIPSSSVNRRGPIRSFVKASEGSPAVTSNGKTSQGAPKNMHNKESTFPSGFEALVLDVCDDTNIAELKVKVGDFEMHLKRDIGSAKTSVSTALPIVSPSTAPPIPSMPMSDSNPAPQPAALPPKLSSAPSSPFAYVSSVKKSKLAALEASGSSGYAIVSSPTVGSFRSGRTVKGKKQPPSCKEGAVIKEGQVIGYLDQFGNELPIKSDVAGEVLKILFKDGEPVGYGDPLVAVLPSFHGIK